MPTPTKPEHDARPAGPIWPRLLAAFIALGAGIAAVIVAIQLVHSTLG
jgi:hypothetical protein